MADSREQKLLNIEKLEKSIRDSRANYEEQVKDGLITDKERLEILKKQNKEELELKKLKAETNKEAAESIKKSKIGLDYSRQLNVQIQGILKGTKGRLSVGKEIANVEQIVVKSAQIESEATGDRAVTFEKMGSFAKGLNDIQLQNLENEKNIGTNKFKQVDLAGKENELAQLKARVNDKTIEFGKGERVFARNRVEEMENQLDLSKKQAAADKATNAKKEEKAKILDKLTGGLFGKYKGMKDVLKEHEGSAGKQILAFGLIAGLIGGIFKIATQFAGQIDSLGKSFGVAGAQSGVLQTNLLESSVNMTKLGQGLEEAISMTNILSSDFGFSVDESAAMADNINDSAIAMGLSADEGAKLFGILMSMGNLTPGQAEDLAESTYQLAQANKVAPQAVMKDIAENADIFAKNMKDGGANVMEAAVQAKKLGLSLSDVDSIAGGLLDFQSSLNAEIEASLMLGRDINLQKARELALNNDLTGMMNEVVKQAGGEYEFNKLNRLEREALGKAIGLSGDKMARLVGEHGKLDKQKSFKDMVGKDALSGLSKLSNSFKAFLAQVVNKLGPYIETATNALDKLITSGGAGFAVLKESFLDFGASVVTFFEGFNKKSEDGKNIWERISETINGLPDMFGSLWTKMKIGLGVIFGLKVAMFALSQASFVAAIAAAGVSLPLVGIGIGLAAALAAYAGISALTSFQDLPTGQSASLVKGQAIFDPGESVVHTEDLKNMGSTNFSTHALERENQKLQTEMAGLRADLKSYLGMGGTAIKGIGSQTAHSIASNVSNT